MNDYIAINYITPNPNNPRKNFDDESLRELAESIREHGIIQPLVVKYGGIEGGGLMYRLICGERRLKAAKMVGLDRVPVVFQDEEITPAEEALKMLIENLQREDLDPIEEAGAYQRVLEEFSYTQEDLATKVGKSQGHIANRLRLLELPETVQENISRGIISASHGKVLAGHKNLPAAVMEKAVEAIANDNVPVSKADNMILRLVAEKGLPLFDNYRKKPEFKSGKGSECYACEHRAMGKDMYVSGDNEQPFCLNPECWERKQEEAQQEALKADEEQNLVDISKLSYTQYEYWNNGTDSYDQSECRDCEHRKKAIGKGDRYYCLDPACMKKKKTAKTRADNKSKNDAFQVELQDIAEMAKSKVDTMLYNSPDGALVIDRTSLIYLAAQVLSNVGEWHDRKVTLYKYLKEKYGWNNDVLKRGSWGLLNNDWEIFHRLLETLDERQLLEVIFEWPAVARGLKGAEGWFLQQVPQPEESKFDTISVITGRVKRCKDCTHINEDRICSAFGFERVSLTSPQHCQYYKLRGDVDIESIPQSVEEANREKEAEREPNPTFDLKP